MLVSYSASLLLDKIITQFQSHKCSQFYSVRRASKLLNLMDFARVIPNVASTNSCRGSKMEARRKNVVPARLAGPTKRDSTLHLIKCEPSCEGLVGVLTRLLVGKK